MRCYIDCNEEVLCIVVNSCAKHVRCVPWRNTHLFTTNVPAGTFKAWV